MIKKEENLLISNKLLYWINFFSNNYSIKEKDKLTSFLKFFVNSFVRENFFIPEEHKNNYLEFSHNIGDLFALVEFKNTDNCLKYLLDNNVESFNIKSENHLIKILTLYSIKNELKLNYNILFNYNNKITTYWYFLYFHSSYFINELNLKNISRHIDFIDRIKTFDFRILSMSVPYFISTYASETKDKLVKYKINSILKEKFKDLKFNTKNNPKSIAIASAFWQKSHAIYRVLYDFVKKLSVGHEVTFINLNGRTYDDDEKLFKKVIELSYDEQNFDLSALENNDFSLIYYPEIGMCFESIILSNLRIAPIQIMGQGHPVSTFGSEIDYYIAGIDSEKIELINENYSEKVILSKGVGFSPIYTEYKIKKPTKKASEFLIVCPWSFQKTNYKNLLNLREILLTSNIKIKFIFLPTLKDNTAKFNCFIQDLENILGKNNFKVVETVNHEKYMEILETSNLVIDSYPFGSYNCIRDALLTNKPIVAFEGNKAYNKFASAVLKHLNLSELVATNDKEYVQIIIKLIKEVHFRQSIINKIENQEIKDTFFRYTSANDLLSFLFRIKK